MRDVISNRCISENFHCYKNQNNFERLWHIQRQVFSKAQRKNHFLDFLIKTFEAEVETVKCLLLSISGWAISFQVSMIKDT